MQFPILIILFITFCTFMVNCENFVNTNDKSETEAVPAAVEAVIASEAKDLIVKNIESSTEKDVLKKKEEETSKKDDISKENIKDDAPAAFPSTLATDELSPINDKDATAQHATNRTGRQLYYSPSFYYIQNFGNDASKCLTSRGMVGVCMAYDKCVQNYQRKKRHLALYSLLQPQGLQQQLLEPQILQQPQILQSQVLQAQLVQPQLVQPQLVQPQLLQPQFVQPQLVQPQLLQPQLLQPAQLQQQQWPLTAPFLQQQSQISQQQQQQQQQQLEYCTFYDQYSRAASGVCCTAANQAAPIAPAQQPIAPAEQPQQPELHPEHYPSQQDTLTPQDETENKVTQENETAGDEDSEVLENPGDQGEPQPQTESSATEDTEKLDNDREGNTIGYDPINDLKQAPLYSQLDFNNYIRYPWPTQFGGGFSGQWPPALPTHPPSSLGSWPPQIPTHPPNHHYPTHPPSVGFGVIQPPTTTRRPFATQSTTRRPTYPNYPTHRPPAQATPTKKPSVPSGGSGSTAMGLPLQCGARSALPNTSDQRIVGGTNASPHEFPWIAVLFKSGRQFCGGSLISHNHILTAAHCVARMTSWDVAALTVHLGDHDIRSDYEARHVSRKIKRLVRHKGFDFSTLHNDIAVLTLSEPVQFTKEIQPVCLPTSPAQQSRSYSGKVATVAGWGSLRENGPQPAILQKVDIPIWTNSECANKYGRSAPGGIIESMVCAGQAARDSCSGDSGGPMVLNEAGRFTQIGIVSWGIGCGKGQYPGVYTRVTSLLPWIYKNIK